MLVELLHPGPSIATTLAAVVFAWILGIEPRNGRLLWIAAIMLLAQFSISALNEWADADLDRRTGRRRPIPFGLLTSTTALIVALLLGVAAIGFVAASGLGAVSAALVVAGLACGYFYDIWLKATPLSFLPFTVAFPLMVVWVGLAAQRPLSALTPVMLGGVPLAAAIHLADAIPDREGDREAGLHTLAVTLGRPAAEIAAAALLLAGTLVGMVGIIRRDGYPGISVAGIAVIYLIASFASRADARRWIVPLGKWMLIGGAFLAAVMLVVVASART